MSVNIGQSLREGVTRAFSRNGILLIIVWTILGGFAMLAYNSWLSSFYANIPTEPVLFGPSLDVAPLVAGVASLVLYLISFVFMAGALRTFVTDETQTLPGRYFTHNIGWMLLNLIVGYILFFLAIWIGFILLIVPGLFLLVSLYFWFLLVVVEDQNFWAAFKNSWALTKGDRWPLLGIGLIIMVAGWVLMGIPMALTFALTEWAGLILIGFAVSVYGVVSLATTARVYLQLSDGQAADPI